MGIYLKKYAWVIYLFFIFIGTYFLAKITAAFIASSLRVEKNFKGEVITGLAFNEKKRLSFDDYKVIIDRNIFDSHEQVPLPTPASTPIPEKVNLEGPAVKTSLPIKLLSTFVVGAGTDQRSTATVASGRGGSDADIYTVGDEKQFAPGVKVTKILPDRIEFINGSRLEFAEIEQFGGGLTTNKSISEIETPARPTKSKGDVVSSGEGGKFIVDRAELEQTVANLDQIFTQIKAMPQIGKDGKTTGLKLLSIKGGSLFSKLGLKRNDVLERINGQEFDMKKGLDVFNQLKDTNHITIDLVRNGQKTTLEYEIQ